MRFMSHALSAHSLRLGKQPPRNAAAPASVSNEEAITMPSIRQSVFIAGVALLLGASAAVFAAPLPNKDQSTGMSSPQTVPEDRATSGSSREPLSDKLDRSDGVIKPPSGVDPEMTQAPPATSRKSMPVIPPPGAKPGINPK
jgi:hypothetical protein